MKLSNPIIKRNVLAGNVGGGTIRVSKHGLAHITENLIYHNPAGGILLIDSWAVVDRNVVMNNGNAGFAYQIQSAAYLLPAMIKNNVFRGNKVEGRVEGENTPYVMDNNIQGGYMGKGNFDDAPKLRCQTRTLEFSYVPRSILGRTLVSTKERVDGAKVVGQVVRVGERWGIVGVPYEPDSALWLWGDVKAEATSLDLLNTFLPSSE